MPAWSTETEALENTPLLDSEGSSRHGKNSLTCYTPKGVHHHSPDSSMNSQLESGPSCSRSPIYRRSSSAETLLSSSADKGSESSERTSSDSPNLQCTYPQQNQPLLSKSGPFYNAGNWVTVELRLENSGSVARDHLASERTFLAYTRTSLAIASFGVALQVVFSTASADSWQKLHVYIRPLGASTVIVGLLVLFIGFTRYFTIQVALIKGVFPVARLATGFVTVMLGVLVTLTFGILLAGKLEQK